MNTESINNSVKGDGREVHVQKLYDILVVGGGIYGAALCYIASKCGYKVLLVEQNDFSSGTSSNSLKILHGGIRYLQSFDFIRVVESAKERARITSLMPGLVRPITCFLPVKTGLIRNKIFISLALMLFDFIRKTINKKYNVYRFDASRIISKNALKKIYEKISKIKNGTALCWQDSQVVSTERVIYKLITLAKKSGADTYNYLSYVKSKNVSNLHAVEFRDEITGVKIKSSVNVIIDATSSWQANKPNDNEVVPYISAVNLVVNKRLTTDTLGIPFQKNNNNRTLFLSSWNDSTLIGTWYFKEIDKVSTKIIDECLEDVNEYFENISIKKEDVTFIHHGKLPSNKVKSTNPYLDIQSQYKIKSGKSSGIFIVQGVKYTTAIDVAEKTLLQINDYFNKTKKAKYLKKIDSSIIKFDDASRKEIYKPYMDKISPSVFDRLFSLYGEDTQKILKLTVADLTLLECVPGSTMALKAEIEYVVHNEDVFYLSDLLLRRTDLGTQAKPNAEMINYCVKIMANKLNWDSAAIDYNFKELNKYYPSWVE